MKKLMWVKDLKALTVLPPENIAGWLVHAPQISPYLRQCYQNVTLSVIEERWDRPYGRTVVPARTYKQYKDIFGALGEAFIGESFLYKNGQVTRTAFEYAAVNINSPLTSEITQSLMTINNKNPNKEIILNSDHPMYWVRRSQFDVMGFSLLLTEAIFSTICAFPLK